MQIKFDTPKIQTLAVCLHWSGKGLGNKLNLWVFGTSLAWNIWTVESAKRTVAKRLSISLRMEWNYWSPYCSLRNIVIAFSQVKLFKIQNSQELFFSSWENRRPIIYLEQRNPKVCQSDCKYYPTCSKWAHFLPLYCYFLFLQHLSESKNNSVQKRFSFLKLEQIFIMIAGWTNAQERNKVKLFFMVYTSSMREARRQCNFLYMINTMP